MAHEEAIERARCAAPLMDVSPREMRAAIAAFLRKVAEPHVNSYNEGEALWAADLAQLAAEIDPGKGG